MLSGLMSEPLSSRWAGDNLPWPWSHISVSSNKDEVSIGYRAETSGVPHPSSYLSSYLKNRNFHYLARFLRIKPLFLMALFREFDFFYRSTISLSIGIVWPLAGPVECVQPFKIRPTKNVLCADSWMTHSFKSTNPHDFPSLHRKHLWIKSSEIKDAELP